MVQGLLIRRIFIFLDLALAALVLVVAAYLAVEMTRPAPEIDLAAGEAPEGDQESKPLPEVGDRAIYDGLTGGGLFGEAGRWDPGAAPETPAAPPVVDEEVTETTLNLRLVGTLALSPTNKFSSAFIENVDQRDGGRAYAVGRQVLENVTLEEVYPREVIVLNKRTTPAKKERLRMDEDKDKAVPASAAPAAPGGLEVNDAATERISLSRDEIIQDITENYAELVTNVRPEMAKDENGNVIGVTAPNIGQLPLAQKLGVQDNDILQTVNNEQIDSEEKIMELVQKYQNASSFRIGIMRGGKPKVITYRLD